MQVIEVKLDAVTAQVTPPMATDGVEINPLPVIVTDVPPNVVPLVGVTDPIVGVEEGVTYVYAFVAVAAPESGLVTTTFTRPAACAPVVQVIDVEVDAVTAQATPPTVTVSGETNPVPVIVIDVPPAVVPLVGVTDPIVGVEIALLCAKV